METCFFCMAQTMEGGRCVCCGRSPKPNEERDPSILPPGTVLDGGSITVGECLGRGGFGITYVAFDHQSNRRIALKEYMPRMMVAGRQGTQVIVKRDLQDAYDQALRSFIREAKILNILQAHPNIVRVYFKFEENNTCYYGMEFLEGETLGAWLRNRPKKITAKEMCEILNPIMDALSFTHSAHILHRDISTDNIYLCRDPSDPTNPNKFIPKLIDFGAAYADDSNLTKSAMAVRKGGYTAIEQQLWGIETQGPWTDVYALSAVMYWMMTGKGPTNALDRLTNKAELESPSKLNKSLPKGMEELLLEGLTVAPEQRIQDVRSVQTRMCQICGMAPYVYFRVPRGVLIDVSDRVAPGMDIPEAQSEPVVELRSAPVREMVGAVVEQLLIYLLFLLIFRTPLSLIYAAMCDLVINLLCCIGKRPGKWSMKLLGLFMTDTEGEKPDFLWSMCYCILHAVPLLPMVDIAVKLANGRSILENALQIQVIRRVKQRTEEAAPASLEQVVGEEYQLSAQCCVGRLNGGANIVINDPLISKQHCLFERAMGGRWFLTDLNSRNGTFLNRVRLPAGQRTPIEPGQLIQIGEHSFVFQ